MFCVFKKQNQHFCFFSGKEETGPISLSFRKRIVFCEAELTLLLLFWKRKLVYSKVQVRRGDMYITIIKLHGIKVLRHLEVGGFCGC
jgi:hypothetical protein